ncbi:PAS domain S-box protein, partial [bacterium]|nr:PAS domain S-box protein [bacterium]
YVPDYKTQPLIRIDEVDADRIYKKPEGIQISESMSSIKIKYHGISFKTQRMRYSYILEGYDEDWKATWDEEVRYESLPIGEYTFKVIAINRDSVYSKKPVELRLTVVADKRDKVISELEEKVRERTEELKEAKDYIDNVIKLMADTLIVINQDGIIKTVNQATLNLLGYEESELIGNPIDMILTAEYEEKLLEESELDDLIERDLVINFEEGFIRNVGNTYLSKGGREIPVLFSGSIIQDDNGEMQGIVCVAQDITGRKQMEEELRKHSDHLEELVQERTEELTKTVEQFQNEIAERQRIEEALRESEKKYRFLYEESPVISFIIGTDGIIKDVNRALLKEFDYSKDEIIGKHAIDFVVPEQREKVSTLLENDFKGEYTPETDIGIYAKDGSIHTVLFSPGQALLYEGNVPTSILVTGIDITERKQAEELARLQQLQLIQAEKMATLGVLSSGVAHEINNPNNFILLNAKIFQRVWNDVMPILEAYYEEHGDFAMAGMPYTQAHEKIGQLISGMSEGSQRIAKIVMGLKDFARQDTGELNQSVDINSVIEVAMLIVGNLVKKSTNRFSCEYGSNLTKIFGNVQQLEQVIINLITNACQAINDKEKGLSISNSYDSNSNNVIVKVCDEGTGMPPECMKYIMDPFFTTKRSSGGTGLGLSISYNIVKAHGGDLKFTSEFGKGTKVVLTLPVHQEVRK